METSLIILVSLAGIGFATGVLYFKGLWWTVQGLPVQGGWSGRLLVSFVLRAALVVAVFYLFMGEEWQRVFALTLGFVAARMLMVRKMGAGTGAPKGGLP